MNDNLTIHNGVMEGQCPDADTNLDNEEVRHILMRGSQIQA